MASNRSIVIGALRKMGDDLDKKTKQNSFTGMLASAIGGAGGGAGGGRTGGRGRVGGASSSLNSQRSASSLSGTLGGNRTRKTSSSSSNLYSCKKK